MYPTCVNESPDGAVFVCVDPNLSLSTLKGVGRVMRLVDSDGDGRADTYTTFAEMDSPRGVVSDGRTVYVMHPPNLTAYRDTNGDGIADTSVDIVKGTRLRPRLPRRDHTTNNVELGPDGWLYVAVGDYGFMKAVGTDGKSISHRGGAVVRVRPDGTNLEIVTVGTRNIYDVAIDPFARVYGRDNTNDGDGWNTRLHYLAPGAHMGYPSFYQNFGTEHFPSLADYGGGSGSARSGSRIRMACGAEQHAPHRGLDHAAHLQACAHAEGLDLRRDAGGVHQPAASLGSDDRRELEPLRREPRGRPVHLQQRHRGLRRPGARAHDDAVARVVGVQGDRRRAPRAARIGERGAPLHAEEELVRRGAKPAVVAALRRTIANEKVGAEARAAAIFTLKQLQGQKANDALLRAAGSADARVRETALRVLVDRLDQLQGVAPTIYVKALADAEPQVQVQESAVSSGSARGTRRARSFRSPQQRSGDRAPRGERARLARTRRRRAGDARRRRARRAPRRAARARTDVRAGRRVGARRSRGRGEGRRHARRARAHTGALANREGEWKGDWWTTRPAHLGRTSIPRRGARARASSPRS
jgi:hypothetical protein